MKSKCNLKFVCAFILVIIISQSARAQLWQHNRLDVQHNLGTDAIRFLDNSSVTRFSFGQGINYSGNYLNSHNIDLKFQSYFSGGTGGNIIFLTGNTNPVERLRINPSGDLLLPDENGIVRLSIGREDNYTENFINSQNIDLNLLSHSGGGTGGNIIFSTGENNPVERMRINSTGNIQIPDENGIVRFSFGRETNYTGNFINSHNIDLKLQSYSGGGTGGNIILSTGSNQPSESVRIDENGNMGIGTSTPTQKLSVDGKISAEEIILEDVVGADFVFEEDYDLRSLAETEQFIKTNKHLPEIPSAAEMAEEGLEIKTMNILLLQKVEELTLHLIRMEKEAKRNSAELTAKILKQEERILQQEEEIQALKGSK